MANEVSHQNRTRVWIIAAGAATGLLIAFVIGLAAGRLQSWPNHHLVARRQAGFMMNARGGRLSNEASLRGVVTAVNGSGFTLAGGGATNTITTNGSTQWQGGTSVKVNDSAVVFGTISNGTFTASRVIVNP